jgi:hypothetical protein
MSQRLIELANQDLTPASATVREIRPQEAVNTQKKPSMKPTSSSII